MWSRSVGRDGMGCRGLYGQLIARLSFTARESGLWAAFEAMRGLAGAGSAPLLRADLALGRVQEQYWARKRPRGPATTFVWRTGNNWDYNPAGRIGGQ